MSSLLCIISEKKVHWSVVVRAFNRLFWIIKEPSRGGQTNNKRRPATGFRLSAAVVTRPCFCVVHGVHWVSLKVNFQKFKLYIIKYYIMAPLSLNILFEVNQLSGLNRLEMADTHVFFTIFSTRACESLYRKNNQHVCFVFFYTRGKKREFFFFFLKLPVSR